MFYHQQTEDKHTVQCLKHVSVKNSEYLEGKKFYQIYNTEKHNCKEPYNYNNQRYIYILKLCVCIK